MVGMAGEDGRIGGGHEKANGGGMDREEAKVTLERNSGGKEAVMVEKTRPGALASTLKEADDMAGQTFNDVGRMEEGAVRLKDRQGKM